MSRSYVKTVSATAHFTGLSRVLSTYYGGRGTIFSLHSVVEDDAGYLDSLRCPVRKLEGFLRWLRERGVEFISLDGVMERLGAAATRPFAAFTFDDGYADNLTHALPVMERFAAPFTVYVTSGMVTRDIDAWWFGLAALIRSRHEVEVPGLGRFACHDLASKKRTFSAIETTIHKNYDLLTELRAVIKRSDIECSALVAREALSEDQLRELARHPLVTIGAHSVTHNNLARSSAAAVHWEMMTSRKILQEITGKPVMHFAYPFGNPRAFGKRELDISSSVGFRTAVTTCHGAIFADHLHHLHALPRVSLWSHDTYSTLCCKLDGLYRAYYSRLGDPVVRM